MANMGVSLVSQHSIALEWTHGLLVAPAVEGLSLPLAYRACLREQLLPAAIAFRDFIVVTTARTCRTGLISRGESSSSCASTRPDRPHAESAAT